MRRLIAAVMLVALFAAPEALACSCMRPDGDPSRLVAEGARIVRGEVIAEVRSFWGTRLYRQRRWRVAVTDRVNIGPVTRITVATPGDSAACGISLTPGEVVVLRLDGDGPAYGVNSCGQVSLGMPDWDAFFRRFGE